jgi:hypothetical protein
MNMRSVALTVFILSSSILSYAQNRDSLPVSQINVPIVINLRPLYGMAERSVATVFTSPNYPNDWIESDCATRYKYYFRRSPLKMQMNGNRLDLGFTGFYKIIGSSRACVNGTVLSPWTPSCRCGFDEGERKVNIGFSSYFTLLPNYVLQTRITRNEPKAVDKCEVCFWGQNVTTQVLKGLKAELDASKKAMEDSFSTVSLRPYLQKAWNMLNMVYAMPGVGYFSLRPKTLRMENIAAKNDQLSINIGISATPVISFTNPGAGLSSLPDMSSVKTPGGFNIFLEAALQYDSLSNVMNKYIAKKRFDLSEGIIKKHIVIENTRVSGQPNGDMQITIDFSGSFNGTVQFTGTPVYDPVTKTITVKDLDYDLKTKNLLLNTAKWLFSKKISSELKKYTSFSLAAYYETAAKELGNWLNREWIKGIRSTGALKELKLTEVYAYPDHLLVRSNCAGNLTINITDMELNF